MIPHLDIDAEYHQARAEHGLPPHDSNSEHDLRIRELCNAMVLKGINFGLLSVKEETGVEGHVVSIR